VEDRHSGHLIVGNPGHALD